MITPEAEIMLKKYKEQRPIYKDFCESISLILKVLLSESPIKKYHITFREKDPDSLAKKIKDNHEIKEIEEFKDLAGCRVAFYIESDIEIFKKYIFSAFNIIDEKPHYPGIDKNNIGYHATHMLVSLKEDRANLPEYSRFKGLKCEIQLTTILYHAWSEVEHDITYKIPEDIAEKFPQQYEAIKGRFEDVMKTYIQPAQHDLNFIAKMYQELEEGKNVFSPDFFNSLKNAKSNNVLYERLKLLSKYIGSLSSNKALENLEILNIAEVSLKKAKKFKIKKIMTALGELPGYSYADVADVCLDVLDRLKYVYFAEVFAFLCRLSIDAQTQIRVKALDILKKMAQCVYYPEEKKVVFDPQLRVLKEIEKMKPADLIKYQDAIVAISGQLLDSSYDGRSYNYREVTMHRGPLPYNPVLDKNRRKIILILQRLYGRVKSNKKIKIIEVFKHISYHSGQPSVGEFHDMILRNINNLMSFYSDIISNSDNLVLKEIEFQLKLFLNVITEKSGLIKIQKLQIAINGNVEYQIFKAFTGFDSILMGFLDHDKFEIDQREKISNYINLINNKTFSRWQSRISKILEDLSTLGEGPYPYCNIFLYELAKKKPKIAERMIKKNSSRLEPFLIDLITGIYASDNKKIGESILNSWIDHAEYLSVCADLPSRLRKSNIPMLQSVFNKAKKIGDVTAFRKIIYSIVENYEISGSGKGLFLRTIVALEGLEAPEWIYGVWFKKSLLFESLNQHDWRLILRSLVRLPNIDYRSENLLLIAGQKFPEEFVNFFYQRVVYYSKNGKINEYRVMPFEFYHLKNVLTANAAIITREIFEWFNSEDWLFSWNGASLLKELFPSSNKVVHDEVIKLVKSATMKNIKVVFSIMRVYEDSELVQKACKVLVKNRGIAKKYKNEIFVFLSQMGVMSGDYGLLNGYLSKKKSIQQWKSDRSDLVRDFAADYEKYLDKAILNEKKRADDSIEMEKRIYGE